MFGEGDGKSTRRSKKARGSFLQKNFLFPRMSFLDFQSYPIGVNLAAFAAAAAAVWFAGTYLTRFAEMLADRLGLGRVFAGALLLGGATSLPEIATTLTAASSGDADLAASNLLGGVAMQFAVLALVDAFVMKRRALTFFTPKPVLLMQGVLLIALLALAVAAVATQGLGSFRGLGIWSVLLAAAYVCGLRITFSYEGHSPWRAMNDEGEPILPTRGGEQRDDDRKQLSTARAGTGFALAALAVLVAGFIVARSGEALAQQTGLGSGFVGATLVALATSLPEVSTTSAAVRSGAYGLAVGNIFGTNALEVALLAVADLGYREGSIYAAVAPSAMFLAALGMVVTCVYLWGVLERRDRTLFGMGVDSFTVLLVYAAGLAVYWSL